jgi:signal peptidase I
MHDDAHQTKTLRSQIIENVRFVIFVALAVIIIRGFLIAPFKVFGESMDNTFQSGQYLFVEKLSTRFSTVERGDVVVFVTPEESSKPFLVRKHLIKRIIGLPGETVSIEDNVVSITNEATTTVLREPYTRGLTLSPAGTDQYSRTLGVNEYFVMGDNRENSRDSRYFGPITREEISGSPLIRLFPIASFGVYPGTYHTYEK